MDASRRTGRPEADPQGVNPAGLAALAAALASLDRPVSTFAVGLSGGPDSVALACCAAQHARTHQLSLHFFHVDHGLFAQAAAWTRACEQVGQVLGVPVHVVRVHVELATGQGVEAAAREARYRALAALAEQHQASPVLLAHHQDDQVETLLHRLLRGSGIDGMRGMQARVETEGTRFLRPWLALARAALLTDAKAWAARHGIALADDPSNLDSRYARGALRRDVLPAVAAHWPGYRATLMRFARHAEAAAEILQEVAASDLAQISEVADEVVDNAAAESDVERSGTASQSPADEPGTRLRLSGLLALSPARQTLVLRAWLAAKQLPMPAEAHLDALCVQLRTSAPYRQLLWAHQDHMVRRHRDSVVLVKASRERHTPDPAHTSIEHPGTIVGLTWTGQASLRIDAWGGALHFDSAEQGIDPVWLKTGLLSLRPRRGSERLQRHVNRPSRSLKNLFQENAVPAWSRDHLPLLYRNDQLVYVAGLGTDVRVPTATPGIRLTWVPDQPSVVLPA